MSIQIYIYSILAFIASFSCTWALIKLPSRYMAIDSPNNRSLHTTPTPRLGGLAIILGMIISVSAYCFNNEIDFPKMIILGFVIVAAISLLDDYVSVSSITRLLVHILAALMVVGAGYALEIFSTTPGVAASSVYISVPLSMLFIVWMINLYNFMDGIDGLAGGMAIFGFGTFSVIGFLEGQPDFAIYNLVIAASSLGFLVWNYPPARIFMGDSGSSSLGFLAAVLSIWAHIEKIIPIWISLVIFSPFIVDATVTIIIRVLKKERFWAAHKTHHYQIIAESGMDRRKLLNYEYVLMFVCSVIAVLSYNVTLRAQALFIFMLTILYIILIGYVRKQPVKSGNSGEI